MTPKKKYFRANQKNGILARYSKQLWEFVKKEDVLNRPFNGCMIKLATFIKSTKPENIEIKKELHNELKEFLRSNCTGISEKSTKENIKTKKEQRLKKIRKTHRPKENKILFEKKMFEKVAYSKDLPREMWDYIKKVPTKNRKRGSNERFIRSFSVKAQEPPQDLENLFGRKFIENKMNVREAIDCLIQRQNLDISCTHLSIGSSQILDLLEGTFDFFQSHKRFRSYNQVNQGTKAELAYKSRFDVLKSQPTGQSKRLPFLVVTGDFFVGGEKPYYAEIKSSKAADISNFYTRKSFFQVLITMSLLNQTFGKLEGISNVPTNSGIIFHHVFSLEITLKTNILFNKKFLKLLIDQYCVFFEDFCNIIKLKCDHDDIKYLRESLLKASEGDEELIVPKKKFLDLHCKFFSIAPGLQSFFHIQDTPEHTLTDHERSQKKARSLYLTAKCYSASVKGAHGKKSFERSCSQVIKQTETDWAFSNCNPDIYRLVVDDALIELLFSPASWRNPPCIEPIN